MRLEEMATAWVSGQLLLVVAAVSQLGLTRADVDYGFERSCYHPDRINHGTVEVFGNGWLVTYSCEPGYVPIGEVLGACDLKTGRWTIGPPFCVARQCPRDKMRYLKNGRAHFLHGGAMVRFSCSPGYDLVGKPSLHCTGVYWSGNIPKCEAFKDPESDNDDNNLARRNQVSSGKSRQKWVQHKNNLTSIMESDDTCMSRSYKTKVPQIPHSSSKIIYLKNHVDKYEWIPVVTYTCLPGYQLENEKNRHLYCKTYRYDAAIFPNCLPEINPCEVDRGNVTCHQICKPVDVNYTCHCRRGFSLAEDGFSCNDIDECNTNRGICGQNGCSNTIGSYICMCSRPGYRKVNNKCLENWLYNCETMLHHQLNAPLYSMANMPKDKTMVTRLLQQSILTLCKETVPYENKLEVDGIVCITLENDSQQIVIKVHELLERDSVMTIDDNSKEGDSCPSDLSCSSPNSDYGSPPDPKICNSLDMRSPKNMKIGIFEEENKEPVKIEPLDGACELSVKGALNVPSKPVSMNEDSVDQENSSQSDIMVYNDKSSEQHCKGSSAFFNTSILAAGFFDARRLSVVNDDSNDDTNRVDEVSSAPDSSRMPKPICCKRCGLILPSPQAFEEHSSEVHGSFTCGYCLKSFTSRPNLQRHIRLHTGQRPYSCDLCPSRFSRRDDLKGHILKHRYPKPFRCNLCEKGYTDRSCLRNHMKKEHNSTLRHVCSQCGEGFDDIEKSMQHKKDHPELQRFQCHACNFIGTNSLSHQKHLLSHTSSGKSYKCVKCDSSFTDAFEYTDHLKEHRADSDFSAFSCCFCDNVLPSYEQFVRHEHSHAQSKTYSCHLCFAQLKSSSILKLHLQDHTDDGMSNEDDLDDDKGGSQYWCTECNTGFSTEISLGEHILVVHEHARVSVAEPENFKCKEEVVNLPKTDYNQIIPVLASRRSFEEKQLDLKAAFTRPQLDLPMDLTKYVMSRPKSREHHLYRPYGTPPVPMSHLPFIPSDNYLSLLNLEYRPFSGNPSLPSSVPWPALALQQRFVRDSVPTEGSTSTSPANTPEEGQVPASPPGIRNPESTSTSTTFDRITTPEVMFRMRNAIFQCDLCDLQFKTFDGIENHSNQAHKRFLCEYCGKLFTAKPNRDRHVRYHTGKRPYKCDLCNKSFFRGDDLRYHRTTRHSEVRPYHCTVCGLTFPWVKDLERHVRTHV